MIALALLALLTSIDGGTDVPYADVAAGIYQVDSSTLHDGGQVGPGWHLSPNRVASIGAYVISLENEKAKLEDERDIAQMTLEEEQGSRMKFFLIGGVVGGVVGIVSAILIATVVK